MFSHINTASRYLWSLRRGCRVCREVSLPLIVHGKPKYIKLHLNLQLCLWDCPFILCPKSQDAYLLFPLKFESCSGNEVLVGPTLIPLPFLYLLPKDQLYFPSSEWTCSLFSLAISLHQELLGGSLAVFFSLFSFVFLLPVDCNLCDRLQSPALNWSYLGEPAKPFLASNCHLECFASWGGSSSHHVSKVKPVYNFNIQEKYIHNLSPLNWAQEQMFYVKAA